MNTEMVAVDNAYQSSVYGTYESVRMQKIPECNVESFEFNELNGFVTTVYKYFC